jgi:hypothetical protein
LPSQLPEKGFRGDEDNAVAAWLEASSRGSEFSAEQQQKPTTSDPEATQPGAGSWKLSPEEEELLDERYRHPTLPASDVSQTLTFELQMQYLKNRPEAQQGKSTPLALNARPASQAVPP